MLFDTQDPSRLRRTLSGASLITFPLFGLASAMVSPKFGGDIAAEVAYVAEHSMLWAAGLWLMMVSFFLAIPAVSSLTSVIRGRWLLPGYLGAGLLMLGAFFHGAILGFALVEVPLATSDIDRTQVITFVTNSGDHPAFVMLLVPFVGFYVGSVLLAIALWRAHVAPVWVSALIVLGLVAEFIGPPAASNFVLFGTQLAAYGFLGVQTLRSAGDATVQGSIPSSVRLSASAVLVGDAALGRASDARPAAAGRVHQAPETAAAAHQS